MFVPLICNQCGGKLEVEESRVSISGDTITALPDQKIECPHCGTRYISGDKGKRLFVNNGGISIGSISIGGEVNGKIVIGNAATGANPSSRTKKQTKKWWEIWK